MKKILFVFSIFILIGCTTKIATISESMKIGDEKTAGISDVLFRHEKIDGTKDIAGRVFGTAFAYELSVVALSDNIIGLSYSEYMQQSPWLDNSPSWIIRSAFGNKYEYPLNKMIRFQNIEFEITGKEENAIKYKRIK